MSIQKEIVRIAQSNVGIREVGGNNSGPEVRMFQGAVALAPGSWPWCAAFTAWVLREALKTAEGSAYLAGKDMEKWRCKDARAFAWEDWAVARGLSVFPEAVAAKAGDFVVFDFSHIGVIAEDQKTLRSNILCIEGNTNGAGDRDSTTGDGVWLKSRNYKLAKCYIRLGGRAP